MNNNFGSVMVLAVVSAIGLFWSADVEAQIQRVNLAKLQSAVSDSAAAGNPAFFATDGVVGNANGWKSSGAGPHWLKLTLPLPMQIGSAQLYLGSDDTAPVANFTLQYYSGTSWLTIPGASFSGNTATVLNVVFSSPVTASMIRFYSTDASVTVREIALYATSYPIGTDVTLNLGKQCSVFASSVAGTNYAIYAVDGYAGTNVGWQSANVSGPHTLEVDFPVASRIGSAQLYSGSATYPVISNFTLNYWNGSAWAAVPGGTVTGNTQGALNVIFSAPVSTTKVQISIPGTGTQFVRELTVLAASTGVTTYPLWTDVVSGDPPATQFETYGDGFWSIVNQANGYALVVSATGASQAQPSATDLTQQFQMLYNLDSDTFRLRHRSTWLCVAAQNAGGAAGTRLVEELDYFAMPHELWRLQTMGGGYYRVVNVWNGLALQTDGQSPAAVTLATPSADSRQQWQFSFRAIYPKKGVAGNEANAALFGASWDYNWSRTPNLPAPAPVVFLPEQWNGAGQDTLPQYAPGWHTDPKPMALLGYNEPDQSGQANMTVANAISLWPQLVAANVPLVGPATSWPLTAWMTNFWSQANSAGLRVDESGFHWYSYPSADTLIGNIQSVYNAWGRPIWITELGVGFSGGTWTEEMNYNFLAEFLWRAEGLACLHRYSIFCFNSDPPTNPWDQTSPQSGVFRSDGVTLTAFGQLYAAWDEDCTIRTNKPYILHNKGAYYRVSNTGAASPGIANIRTNDLTVQWRLVAAPTTSRNYIVSIPDGRELSWNGSALSLAASGTTGSAVEWTYTADANGYFFIDNTGTPGRLCLTRSNDGTGKPVTTNLTMVASGTVTDTTRWRFLEPYQPVPLGLTAVASNAQVTMSWTAVSGATSYNLKRSTVSGGPYTNLASGITGTSYTDTGLVNNATYYYVVSAMIATGESANSAEAAAIPGGRAVNCGGSAAGWFSADAYFAGGGASSTTDTIDMSGLVNPAPQSVYKTSRYGSCTYTITGLTANSTYWVRLHFAESYWGATGSRLFNVSINGTTVLGAFDIFAAAGGKDKAVIQEFYKPSNGSGQMAIQFTTVTDNAQINGIEVLPSKPPVPVRLWAAAGNGQVTLTWTAGAGAASYNIYRGTAPGGPYSLISTGGTVTDTGYDDSSASSGTPYYYVITAYNPYGESGRSSEVSAALVCVPPSAPTANNNGPICAGSTLNLTASTVSGATYSWTGPNGFTSGVQNPSIAGATTNASGVYSVTATAGGCASPAGTTTVAVNALPSTPVAGNNGPVCAGSTLNLTASSVAGATYNWTGPNGFTSTLQNPSIAGATTNASGAYSVTATAGGCASPAGTTTATVNALPSTPVAGNNGPIFAGMTLNLTASTVGGANYTWTGPNGFSSTDQNHSIVNATTNAAGSYRVTASIGACTSTAAATTVTVNPPVVLSLQPSGSNFTLVWPGGTLLSATNLNGAWFEVPAANSPYPVTPSAAMQFYRIKLQ